MSPAEVVVALVVVAAGACVQGAAGFGQSIVAAPLLLLIDERLVPGPLLVAAMAITGLTVWRERRHVDLGGFRWAFTGRIPGMIVGALALAALSSRGLGVTLAVIVLGAVAVSTLGVTVRRTPATSIAAGFASGFGATTTSIGGPPMALLYQDASGPSLRGTLAGFFAVGNLLSMVTLTVVGELGSWELFTGLLFVPAVFAGFRLSVLVTPVLDRGYTRPVVLTVSVAGALGVLLRALS